MSQFCFLLACVMQPHSMTVPVISSPSQVTIDDIDQYREDVQERIDSAKPGSEEEGRWERVRSELDDAESDEDSEDVMEDNLPLDEPENLSY